MCALGRCGLTEGWMRRGGIIDDRGLGGGEMGIGSGGGGGGGGGDGGGGDVVLTLGTVNVSGGW